jgi:hypothetical protein
MLVFVVRPDALYKLGHRSPSPPFSLRRVTAITSLDFASCRSRNFGTAFHSPATALSPPSRGQRSRPAPSIPHNKPSQIRSTPNSFAPFGFESRSGARSSPEARYPRQFAALLQSPRHPLPFGSHQPSGSKRSTGLTTRSSSHVTSDCLSLPAAVPFRFQLRIDA